MKKAIALLIITLFIFSLVPLAFAQDAETETEIKVNEDATKTRVDIRTREEIRDDASKIRTETRTRVEERLASNLQKLQTLRQEHRTKIEALDASKIDRLTNLSTDRLQKIAELDRLQIERLAKLDIKNLEKIAELKKERLERISKLSEEKLERLSELEKEKLEKVSDLNDSEIAKFSTLSRAGIKELAKLDAAKLKAELKSIKVVKVKNADDLNEREVPAARLAQLRNNFDNAEDDFHEATEQLADARQKLKEARDKKDENAILEHAKTYLLKVSDALISHLEKLKAKVQESENIADETAAKLIADIDSQIAEINQIKSDVQAATTKAQIKESAKKLHDKWSKLKHLVRLHAERVVSARVEGIVNRGLVLEKRLDQILAKAKDNGIEIDVSTEVNAFSEKIALAKDKHEQAQAKLKAMLDLKSGNATNEQVKATADEANALLKEARDALKEAHDILKTIIKKIKEAMPDADLSEEVEVEVTQETETTSTETSATATTETQTDVDTTAST